MPDPSTQAAFISPMSLGTHIRSDIQKRSQSSNPTGLPIPPRRGLFVLAHKPTPATRRPIRYLKMTAPSLFASLHLPDAAPAAGVGAPYGRLVVAHLLHSRSCFTPETAVSCSRWIRSYTLACKFGDRPAFPNPAIVNTSIPFAN